MKLSREVGRFLELSEGRIQSKCIIWKKKIQHPLSEQILKGSLSLQHSVTKYYLQTVPLQSIKGMENLTLMYLFCNLPYHSCLILGEVHAWRLNLHHYIT